MLMLVSITSGCAVNNEMGGDKYHDTSLVSGMTDETALSIVMMCNDYASMTEDGFDGDYSTAFHECVDIETELAP
jgi:hypothetical protein